MSAGHAPGLHRGARIAFVLPTKNEEATISSLLTGLKDLSASCQWSSVIFVADDSSDNTARVAADLGARVISGGNVGLGQAMFRGLQAALEHGKKEELSWVISLDADGQVDLGEIPLFLEQAISRRADVVLSSRFLEESSFDYPYPFLNWVGNRMLVLYLRLATGLPITDSHGGLRVMRAEALSGLSLIGRHTYVQETIVQWARKRLTILELPGKWRMRKSGDSRVLHSILRYAVRTSPALLYHIRVHYLFFALSAIFLADAAYLHFFPFLFSGAATVFSALAAISMVRLPRGALRI